MKPNLLNGTPEDIRQFVVAVVGLATLDHNKQAPRKSGAEVVDNCAGEHRKMHVRMASGIYNNSRLTLELADDHNER